MSVESKPILLLQLRDQPEALERERQAILRTTNLPPNMVRSVDVLAGADLVSSLQNVQAVIIGGAKYSVFEDMPRLDDLTECMIVARENGLPMLGICFGIQLMAYAFGGRVVRDQANSERGTYDAWLTVAGRQDPLFSGLPNFFPVQCSHHDQIVDLPEDARLLATSQRCRVQAFVMPGGIYGVQFHPERNRAEMESIFTNRADELINQANQITTGGWPLRESPQAALLMRRFVEMVGLSARQTRRIDNYLERVA